MCVDSTSTVSMRYELQKQIHDDNLADYDGPMALCHHNHNRTGGQVLTFPRPGKAPTRQDFFPHRGEATGTHLSYLMLALRILQHPSHCYRNDCIFPRHGKFISGHSLPLSENHRYRTTSLLSHQDIQGAPTAPHLQIRDA